MRAALLTSAVTFGLISVALGACGGGDTSDDGQAPPANITLDAYAAHNTALEVQQRWEESSNPKVAGLCSVFYDSPRLAEVLRERPNSMEAIDIGLEHEPLFTASAAELEAADACAEGVRLEPWQSDELEEQLADRREAVTAQEEATRLSAARVIDQVPEACAAVHEQLAPLDPNPRAWFDASTQLQEQLVRSFEKVPDGSNLIAKGVALDDVAEDFVFSCGRSSPPDKAAEDLRHPDTPAEE